MKNMFGDDERETSKRGLYRRTREWQDKVLEAYSTVERETIWGGRETIGVGPRVGLERRHGASAGENVGGGKVAIPFPQRSGSERKNARGGDDTSENKTKGAGAHFT